MSNDLRIGFLGAGLRRSGVEAALGVVRAGVYDPDRARAEAFATAAGHRVCDSEDDVLDGCDAVYICTWTSEHPRQVAKAVERGLAIFCEKPLAVTTAAAEEMAAQVAAAGLTNQVGLVLRRSPTTGPSTSSMIRLLAA
jgi:predicted dehydrogenase